MQYVPRVLHFSAFHFLSAGNTEAVDIAHKPLSLIRDFIACNTRMVVDTHTHTHTHTRQLPYPALHLGIPMQLAGIAAGTNT